VLLFMLWRMDEHERMLVCVVEILKGGRNKYERVRQHQA